MDARDDTRGGFLRSAPRGLLVIFGIDLLSTLLNSLVESGHSTGPLIPSLIVKLAWMAYLLKTRSRGMTFLVAFFAFYFSAARVYEAFAFQPEGVESIASLAGSVFGFVVAWYLVFSPSMKQFLAHQKPLPVIEPTVPIYAPEAAVRGSGTR